MPYAPRSNAPALVGQRAAYQKPQFAQYQAPQDHSTEQKAQTNVSALLDSEGSLSPEVVAQIKARSKQNQVAMADQAKQAAAGALTARGFQANGGTRQGANAAIDFNTINAILGANRDTDIAAATTNRADKLNALSAAEQFMQGRQARSTDQFRNVLAGQGAQADSDFRVTNAGNTERLQEGQFGLNQWIAQQQAEQAAAQSKLQEDAFGFDVARDLRDFGETQRQFNNRLGFDYTQLNNNNNNSLMQYLLGVFG